VRRLVETGFHVLLCTGRSVGGTRDVWDTLGLETVVVAFNGAWIGRPGATPWRCQPIPDDLVHELARTESHAHFFFRHDRHRKYAVSRSHALYDRVAHWYRDVIHVEDERRLPRVYVMRTSCYFGGNGHHERGWEALPDHARDRLHRETYPLSIFPAFADTDLVLCEVQADGRGKAEAFVYLREVLDVPAARTIAVGDQHNDLTMLAEAGLAVSVANGIARVREQAHLVIGPHDDHGVAAWVEAGMPTVAAGPETAAR
jgi:hydroxymethylpyrimidine pyrophosphatase-like HAD family hydrolase